MRMIWGIVLGLAVLLLGIVFLAGCAALERMAAAPALGAECGATDSFIALPGDVLALPAGETRLGAILGAAACLIVAGTGLYGGRAWLLLRAACQVGEILTGAIEACDNGAKQYVQRKMITASDRARAYLSNILPNGRGPTNGAAVT